MNSSSVLFIGKGKGAVTWYRTGLPAFVLGCDWVSYGKKDKIVPVTGWRRNGLDSKFTLDEYEIVVFQQPHEYRQLHAIREAQRKGTKVFYEIDDYIHIVHKMNHSASTVYTKKLLAEHEMVMRVCDGLIVSTEYLAKKYRKFNSNVFICPNGVMIKRVKNVSIPKRHTVNIGFAGGEGHWESVEKWIPAVEQILSKYDHARFVSIGIPVADKISKHLKKKAVSFTGCSIENFPMALTNFDVAIGPAVHHPFFYAKSDLRWLETASVGVPLVADPLVYKEIEDGVTGMLAESAEDAYKAIRALVEDEPLRRSIGENARKHVSTERDIEKMSENWIEVFMKSTDSAAISR